MIEEEVKPVDFKGEKVVPGEIENFHGPGQQRPGEKFPLVGEEAAHYVVMDNGSPKKVLKQHEHKFYKVNKRHQLVNGDNQKRINDTHFVGKPSKKQKDLIKDMNFDEADKNYINEGIHSEYKGSKPFMAVNKKGNKVFVKPSAEWADEEVLGPEEAGTGFTQAHREVAFHDAMHNVFGLGEHMPTTVMFKMPGSDQVHTAQEFRQGKHLWSMGGMPDRPHPALDVHTKSGFAHKMAITDWILGNSDRHPGNFLVGEDKLHMIDHGGSFHYSWPHFSIPEYLHEKHHEQEFDPAVKNWVMGINSSKLDKSLQESGVPDWHRQKALERLERIQDAVYTKERGLRPSWLIGPGYRERV